MPKVFFCYRREDSTHQSGRISDRLVARFGRSSVFKDVDSTPLGRDFRRVLAARVAQSDVVLVFIGDHWLDAKDESGRRRLDIPHDFVRIEIESALSRNKLVIPVLVGQAPVPRPADLPEPIRNLSYRHGIAVRPDPYFDTDVERLISGISKELEPIQDATTLSLADTKTIRALEASPDHGKSGSIASLGAHSREFVNRILRTVGPATNVPTTPGAHSSALSQDRLIRVGILKSGNATYVNEIERSLQGKLRTELAIHHCRLAPSHDCVEWSDEDQWPTTVSRLMSRGGKQGFDFVIGIGTQAAMALYRELGTDFGNLPTLLLGVTYPRLAGLVDSEFYRCESRQIACIRYGCGLDAMASLLYHRIFPGRKLCFVFRAGTPQDEMAYDELLTTRFVREGHLRLLRLDGPLKAEDLADKETVYFSWYTFTRLFHENEFSILKDRLVVSIMQDNVSDGAAPVGVGTDHDWIGEQGAELIVQHVAAPIGAKPDWGIREVMISPLVYWLHRGLARKHGVEFTATALKGADEVYD